MSENDRSLTGTIARRTPNKRKNELTFPAQLIQPQQSQLMRSEDAVSNRVSQLDAWAQKLGQGFGISFTNFVLNPRPPRAPATNGWDVLGAIFEGLDYQEESVSLERRGGKWGLYFTRAPAVMSQERNRETVPLKDTPLDVRERFLIESERFVRAYLASCEDRLGRMQNSVMHADRTLALLGGMRLE
jgi:hypothetical protein